MRSTTATYKQIISSGYTRDWVVTINMTLADNTSLTITEADIMQTSFRVMTASSVSDSFDIGSAVIGKCTFTLNNYNDDFTQYDFFNATAVVWIGLEGDETNNTQNYNRLGFFTVDEPKIAGSLVSLELLDYMWKFDVPLDDVTITYGVSTTARDIVSAICSHCGVQLYTQQFHGYNFIISQAPEDTENMNCREMLSYIAMIGCNFCVIDSQGYLNIKWYAPTDTQDVATFTWLKSCTLGTDEITITGLKMKVGDTDHTIGSAGYVLELENPLVNENNVNSVLNLMWDVLDGFTLRTFNVTTLPDIAPEVGDYCAISYKNDTYYSHITNYTFTPSLVTASLGAVTPTRTLTKRYSQAVRSAVAEARQLTDSAISDYDLAVQVMNDLAVNAMGGYEDYEDLPTGGRVWYLSNKPITKTGNVCTFESGSTVFKRTGEGLYVSTDGGQTWQNGYNAQTGQLVVNVLNAIGISAEWIKTGILDVGGSGTNATIRVKDSSNNIICTINQNGITMSKGVLQSADYSYTSGHFSDSGMIIDLINTYLQSTAFELNNAGGHIGLAEFDEDSLQVVGDVELYTGSGTFEFRPTDYYFATDFKLLLKTTSGTASVTLILHEDDQDETIGTYTATTSGVETATLDHTIGTDPDDYYKVVCSGACTVSVKDAYLAYMGLDGFKGTLEGIFRGFMDSQTGRINGYNYNGYGEFVHGERVIDWGDLKQYDHTQSYGMDSNHYFYVARKSDNTAKIVVGCDANFDDESNDGADELENNHSHISLTVRGETGIATIYKQDVNGTDSVVWDKTFGDHFTISTVDIGEGTSLAQGYFWLVYEA